MSTARRAAAPLRSTPPTLRLEKKLLREGHVLLAACDEVGRGALGGPATVGVVLIDAGVSRPLPGLRDSKLLAPAARVALVPRIRRWVVEHAVGHASAAEVDEVGILAALRLAAARGLASLASRPDVILLDGNHDYLSPPGRKLQRNQPSLFEQDDLPELSFPRVVTQVKGDMTCSAVAAASILAKTERDAIMVELASRYPEYGWDENKGYATPEHFAALRTHGPCEQHRQSWRLPRQELEDLGLIDVPGPLVGGSAALEAALIWSGEREDLGVGENGSGMAQESA